MNKEFKICVYLDTSKDANYKLLNKLSNIIFESARNSAGAIFSDNCTHDIYGWGSHADAVRVYSALKANKYKIIACEGV